MTDLMSPGLPLLPRMGRLDRKRAGFHRMGWPGHDVSTQPFLGEDFFA